jgi:SAM-dependent methyltransferase
MTGTENIDQYEAWNGDSGRRWVRDPDRRDRVMAPVGDALLAAAALGPGEWVLDIGCGCGATTLAAARAVGTDGNVSGIDLSGPMLEVARSRRDSAGATNVDLIDGDAQTYPFAPSFDLAMSRFGTMFFADPTAAFANIATALCPGGRLCLATWQPLAANDWLTIPGTALLRYGTMPAGGDRGPGMFAQSEPDIITSILTTAGYVDVGLDPVTLDLPLGADPAEATDHLADSGPGRAVLATVAERDRSAALDAVRTTLADHTDSTGVHLGAAVWIITASR